jgi:putative endonuclease
MRAGSDRAGARRDAYRRGLRAETLVAWALRLRGFTVIARRFRTPVGEIDLVARRGRLLVFVEVKARVLHESGAEAVSPAARRRIAAAADRFVAGHPRLAGHDRRFDVALVAPRRWPVIVRGAFDADP